MTSSTDAGRCATPPDILELENEEMAYQLAKAFEELSLLRELAATLVLQENGNDDLQSFDYLLEELREAASAESVLLLIGDTSHPSATTLASAGGLSEEDHLCLINEHRARAESRTLVLNQPHATIPARCLVLTKLSSGPRDIGWLLACNHNEVNENEEHVGFSSVEASLLSSAASIMAAYHRNVELLRQKEELFTEMVRALVNAVDARDPYTCGHSERVAQYAKHLGEQVGLAPPDCERLYLTGLLHDVGKIAVPDAILRKCGRLSDVEFHAIAQHPRVGYRMLSPLTALKPVLPGVLHHHENYDGSGYPEKLQGDDIPLDARLLAICDSYDAMTSDRPYRRGMPHEKALEILANGAGEQWDAELIQAFVACSERIRQIGAEFDDGMNSSRQVTVEQPIDAPAHPLLDPTPPAPVVEEPS